MAGKLRSPNYPGLSLQQAVEAVDRLWKGEKRTPVSHETAATALGYKALSGPARVAIGALRQYGLIDKAEKGHIAVSDLAVAILHGHGTEKEIALGQAALMPDLFSELHKSHPDASENALKAHLITKRGFAEDGARKAARAFRETLAFGITGKSGYNASETKESPEIITGVETGQNQGIGKPQDGVFALTVPFAKGSIAVQVKVIGEPISPTHLARVRKYLELAESEWNGGE